jgi:hypothetical protein
MSIPLHALLEHPALWRGEDCARNVPALASGFETLDRCLPGGGWPQGALTEIYPQLAGIGELTLLMPACAQLTRTGRWIVFVAPPYIPYAPALAEAGVELSRLLLVQSRSHKEALWALEQSLKSEHCGAALAWAPAIDDRSLRRLQLACEQGESSAFLYMQPASIARGSTAALRIELEPGAEGELCIRILKRRGGVLARPIKLAREQLAFEGRLRSG